MLNRGGNYGNGANAGEANGNLNNPRSNANDNLGFFCAFLITSEHAGARYRRTARREDKGRFPLPKGKTDIAANTFSSKSRSVTRGAIFMRTFNITYDDIIDYENLYGANIDAKKCKTERNEVMRFNMDLDENLIDLYNDLKEKKYKQRGYRLIYITVPKKRLIMALQYRDRVLQWAVYRKLNPLYERIYIEDSYGCRKDKGREKAAVRLQYWLRQTDRKEKQYYYLKLDISKFFYRVDHEVLLKILAKKIKDKDLLELLEKIINSNKRAFGLPLGVDPSEIDPRDMLFDKGMPIGNLTSQMFANIYLNELDQFIKHELHLHYAVRYMDDIIILHDDYKELVQFKEKIEAFLENVLKLNLNNKTAINPTTHNIEFVGFIINKNEIKLRKDTVRRMRVRIKYVMKAYEAGEMTFKEVNATMQSYFGLISHCTNKGLREKIIRDFVLHCTDKSRERALREI